MGITRELHGFIVSHANAGLTISEIQTLWLQTMYDAYGWELLERGTFVFVTIRLKFLQILGSGLTKDGWSCMTRYLLSSMRKELCSAGSSVKLQSFCRLKTFSNF